MSGFKFQMFNLEIWNLTSEIWNLKYLESEILEFLKPN
jgi:hypothetical protein